MSDVIKEVAKKFINNMNNRQDIITAGYPEIIIGSYRVTPTKHFLSLEYEKISIERLLGSVTNPILSQAGNTMNISLVDEVENIERALFNSNGTMTVKLPGGPLYKMFILGVSTTYGPITSISIECVSVGTQPTSEKNSRIFENMLVSDIAKKVIEGNVAWKVKEIEVTEPVKGLNGEEHMTFTQSNQSDYVFLRELAKSAKSAQTKAGDYSVILEDSVDGVLVSFVPKKVKEEKRVIQFSLWDVSNARSGEVIEFSPDLSQMALAIYYSDGAEQKTEEPKEKVQTLESNKTKKSERVGQDTLKVDTDNDYSKKRVESYFERASNVTYGATISLYGIDYSLSLYDVISIYAYRSDGSLHYSSGRYYISKITNKIDMGKCSQELELFRESTMVKEAKKDGQGIRTNEQK